MDERPIFLDGFEDAIRHGHTDHPDDNPYVKESPDERSAYREYRDGARAGQLFRRHKITLGQLRTEVERLLHGAPCSTGQ